MPKVTVVHYLYTVSWVLGCIYCSLVELGITSALTTVCVEVGNIPSTHSYWRKLEGKRAVGGITFF